MRWLKTHKAVTLAALFSLLWVGGATLIFAPLIGAQGANSLLITDAPSGSAPAIRANGVDANISIAIVPKGTGTVSGPFVLGAGSSTTGNFSVGGNLTVGGSLAVTTPQSVTFFVPAASACISDSANLIKTRLATGDWALARTAAGAETFNIECPIEHDLSVTAGKGFRLTSFSVVHQITVVALTSATYQGTSLTAYANNVANAVTTYGGGTTITLPTATQANPYVTAATITTPAFVNSGNQQITVDYQVVLANTGVYRLYGIIVNGDYAPY